MGTWGNNTRVSPMRVRREGSDNQVSRFITNSGNPVYSRARDRDYDRRAYRHLMGVNDVSNAVGTKVEMILRDDKAAE